MPVVVTAQGTSDDSQTYGHSNFMDLTAREIPKIDTPLDDHFDKIIQDFVTFPNAHGSYTKITVMEQRINYMKLPEAYMKSLMGLSAYLYKVDLDRKLMHLIAYRVSQINSCAFCLDMHHKDAIHAGETEQRLHSLPAWRECPYYSEPERPALQLAESLTMQCEVDDATYAQLEKHFTKEQIADIALAVSVTNVWNRLNKTFRTTPGTYEVNQFSHRA